MCGEVDMFHRLGILLCLVVGTAQAGEPSRWVQRFVEKEVPADRRMTSAGFFILHPVLKR